MRELIGSIYGILAVLVAVPILFIKKNFSTSGWSEGIEISFEMVKKMYKQRKFNFLAKNVTNMEIPASLKVIELESKEEVSLKSICESSSLPVVLNFGSCS